MFKNCMSYCFINHPYVEVDNNTANVLVSFTISYLTHGGEQRTLQSPILHPDSVARLNLATRSSNLCVFIYNRSTPDPTILLAGELREIKRTCFEVNGTLATVRCREVDC